MFHYRRKFCSSVMPSTLLSDIWSVTDCVPQETDSVAEISIQEIDWGVASGPSLGVRDVRSGKGRGWSLKQPEGASVCLRESSEPAMALQKYLKWREACCISVPFSHWLPVSHWMLADPRSSRGRGMSLGKQISSNKGESQGRDSAVSCQMPVLLAAEE